MSTSPELSCPRCGYDVSGVVPTWKEVCPLDGTCSECGLGFAWVDLFRPDRNSVPGFVEHSRGFLPTIVAAWRTWAWTVWPRVFFGRVGLEAPMRPLRVAAYMGVLFGTLHFTASLLGTAGGYELNPFGFSPRGRWDSTFEAISVWTYPWVQVSEGNGGGLWPPWVEFLPRRMEVELVLALGSLHTMFAVAIAALLPTFGRTPLRLAHVVRAWAYGLSCFAWLGVFRVGRNLWLLVQWLHSLFVYRDGGVDLVTIRDIPEPILSLLALSMVGWVGVWWYSAYAFGWRIAGWRRARPVFVFGLIATCALMGTSVVMGIAAALLGDR